ncbi:putative metalloprotease CJM1_0395 family protein [Oceanisphaera sp. KMM 10153]|uniref:putative metalloprotease CJM1_0395 family protein n=1 Tax=Oceanisphaera submarina TaxID=3390193 RepID=UPI003975B2E6
MQLGTSLPEFSAFAASPPLRQVTQEHDQRALIAPVETMDSFTSADRQQQDARHKLYDRFGRSRNDDAAQAGQEPHRTAGDQPANDEAEAGKETQAETITAKEKAEKTAEQDHEALSPEQEELLQALQLRDREVRLHEQQHAGVGGQHAGAPSYEYETGPDGKQYAVAGEVQVDLSPVADDPAATIDKMQQIKAAALAPAEPSQADKAVAARAEQYILEAQAELQQGSSEHKSQAESNRNKVASTQASDDLTQAHPYSAAADVAGQMALRNQVIAGAYGKAAQADSRSLLKLA